MWRFAIDLQWCLQASQERGTLNRRVSEVVFQLRTQLKTAGHFICACILLPSFLHVACKSEFTKASRGQLSPHVFLRGPSPEKAGSDRAGFGRSSSAEHPYQCPFHSMLPGTRRPARPGMRLSHRDGSPSVPHQRIRHAPQPVLAAAQVSGGHTVKFRPRRAAGDLHKRP